MLILRWLLILPTAALSAVLIRFPVHLALYFLVGKDDSWMRLNPREFAGLELLVVAVAAPFGFVSGGSWIAPKGRVTVAFVLGLLVFGMLANFVFAGAFPNPMATGALTFMGVAGGVGFIYFKDHQSKAEDARKLSIEENEEWLRSLMVTDKTP